VVNLRFIRVAVNKRPLSLKMAKQFLALQKKIAGGVVFGSFSLIEIASI
jgi:hypothetical protein